MRAAIPEGEASWTPLIRALFFAGKTAAARAEATAFELWLAQNNRELTASPLRLLEQVGAEAAADHAHEQSLCAAAEFSAILWAQEGAVRGAPRHVPLSAPAGFGKTRLLDEAA